MRINEEGLEIVASVTLAEALSAILGEQTTESRGPSDRRSDLITQPVRILYGPAQRRNSGR